MRLRFGKGDGDNERQASAPRFLSAITDQKNASCRAGRKNSDGERTDKILEPAEADKTQREDASGQPLFRCSNKLQNGVFQVIPLRDMMAKLEHSTVAAGSCFADAPDDAGNGGGRGAFVAERVTLIRLPFPPHQLPVCTRSLHPRSKAGPSLHTVMSSLLQLMLSCCSSTLKTRLSLDDQVLNPYMCAHLLQELATRIQQVTGLILDPFEKKQQAQGGTLPALQPVETSGAGGKLDEHTDMVSVSPLVPRRSGCAQRFLPDACGLLQRTPEMEHLFSCYATLLAGDEMTIQSLRNIMKVGCHEEARCTSKRSSSLVQLFTAPLFSCSPCAPRYLWQKARSLGGERRFRISVHLLHVDLAEFHLFREEDTLAHRLLEVYEVYAYMAQTANGEQLTTKLRSCLKSSEQMRNACGVSQLLQPLQHIAQSIVSVFCQQNASQPQQELLHQYLHHLPQLALQLQNLIDSFVRLMTANSHLWKEWLHHLQQRRVLRHQRDHEAHQFAAAGRAVESLWQSLERQRKNQGFDGTGLQMHVLLLGRDEPSDRHQLLQEVVSELEEVLTYVVDTRCPESLAEFDLSAAAVAVLEKLSDQARRKPGQPLRLLLLSSKANATGSLASLSKEPTDRAEGAAAREQRPLLPVQEQLRRFLCQNLSAVATCQVNGRSAGRQEHVTLHFPSFSTSQAHGIMSPVVLCFSSTEMQQLGIQHRDTIVASFEAALSVPLSKLSVHLGLAHTGTKSSSLNTGVAGDAGLPKALETHTEVPVPKQLQALTSELVYEGRASEKQSLASSAGFPVTFSLDLPFSFKRVTREDTQREGVATASASKAAVCFLPFEPLKGSALQCSCGNPRRHTDSTSEMMQGGPCVLRLPSFLSPEATAARVQQLQGYPLLNTPQWNRGFTADTSIQDLQQLQAPLVAAESYERALVTVSPAAVGTASSSSSPGAAPKGPALADTVNPPAAAADKSSGLLHLGFRKIRHPMSPTPAPPEPEDEHNGLQEPTRHLLTAAGAEVAETLVYHGGSQDVAAADMASDAAADFHRASEHHKKTTPGVSKSADRNCQQASGCLKLRVLVSPIPENQEGVGGFSCLGAEWLAVRRAVVEGKACEAFEGACTRRRLPGSQEAFAFQASSPSLLLLHEGHEDARVDEHLGPSLRALVAASHTSLQLYSHHQTKACPRLRLRQKQLYVMPMCDGVPATDWEAVLLTVLSKQLAKVDEATRAGYLFTATRAVGFEGGSYEQKLRQYLLSNDATAASAKTLLICLTGEAATLKCNLGRGAEANGFTGEAESATLSASHTREGFPERGEQALQLVTQKPVVHYAAIVREISWPLMFWRLAGWRLNCNPLHRCQFKAMVLLPVALRHRILRAEKKQQRRRLSNLWGADDESSPRTCSPAPPSIKVELKAFVRGLYNVPRRRHSASPAGWHGRYRLGHQPGHMAPGFENFAVYEAALPAATGAPEIFSQPSPTVDILQLSCPIVALRVCLPDVGVDAFTATMPTEGENPAINQALSLKLPQLEHIESERLYRQRGFVSILVFDQLHPRLLSDTHSRCNRVSRQQLDAAPPFVFLGSFELEWRSLLSSAEATASNIVGPAAAAEAFSQGSRPSQQLVGHECQQKVLTRLLGVGPDGTCCLCILNGCFRLRQPRGLLSHSRVTQFSFSAAPGKQSTLEAPLDMFVSLKVEIRGPASALCGGRPRHLLPEVQCQQQEQHQQRQRLDSSSHHIESFPLNETSMLINHDLRWRQKASRCGVWTPPTIIGMDTSGCSRLLCRLLLPALPPIAVAVPFDPHCFEKTAAFVSLLPAADSCMYSEGLAVWLTPQQALEAGCCPPRVHALLLCCFFQGLDSRMQTGCSSFVAQGESPPAFSVPVNGGERFFVLRLAPSGAAQLWDPLSGEALCLIADEKRNDQALQHHKPHRHKLLEEDEELWKKQLDVLMSLQRIDAERQSVRHRVAVLFPAAQRDAASQHANLNLTSTMVLEEEGAAAASELQVLEQYLVELQAREDALLHEWRSLHAAASRPLPFFLGGPQQKCQEGLWPISRLSLLFNQQNAYMNLQPMSCCNCRNSSAEASASVLIAEDSPAEFVPLTASAGIPENEQHLRQTIRSRLQRRRRWRCFGVPALAHTLREVGEQK
ncbi:hypothetical protein Emag_006485 [Eimeria magna]